MFVNPAPQTIHVQQLRSQRRCASAHHLLADCAWKYVFARHSLKNTKKEDSHLRPSPAPHDLTTGVTTITERTPCVAQRSLQRSAPQTIACCPMYTLKRIHGVFYLWLQEDTLPPQPSDVYSKEARWQAKYVLRNQRRKPPSRGTRPPPIQKLCKNQGCFVRPGNWLP